MTTQSSQQTEFSDTSTSSSWTTSYAVNEGSAGYATMDCYTYGHCACATSQPHAVQGPFHVPPSEFNEHLPAPTTSQLPQDASIIQPLASSGLSRRTIDVICTICDQSTNGASCGARISYKDYDRQALVVHLQTTHGVHHPNLNSHAPGEPLIECPDTGCICRFRRKECARRDANGRPIPHRTHVVDIIRHYIDKHLQPVTATTSSRFECDLCGKGFTRSGSVARHQRNNCPRRSRI